MAKVGQTAILRTTDHQGRSRLARQAIVDRVSAGISKRHELAWRYNSDTSRCCNLWHRVAIQRDMTILAILDVVDRRMPKTSRPADLARHNRPTAARASFAAPSMSVDDVR